MPPPITSAGSARITSEVVDGSSSVDAGGEMPPEQGSEESGLDKARRSLSTDERSWTFEGSRLPGQGRLPELLPEPLRERSFGIDLARFEELAGGLDADLKRACEHWLETYNHRGHRGQLDKLEGTLAGVSWWGRLRHKGLFAFLSTSIARERERLGAEQKVVKEQEREASPRLLANLRRFDPIAELEVPRPKGLSDDERQALGDYMAPNGADDSGGSTTLNSALRGQRPLSYVSYVAAHRLLSALSKLPGASVERRGKDVSIWRGSSHLPGGISDPSQLVVGQTVIDPAFASCSRTKIGILRGDFLIRIDRPKHARDISGFGEHDTNDVEEELLFRPGTVFKYLGFDAGDGAHVFTTDV